MKSSNTFSASSNRPDFTLRAGKKEHQGRILGPHRECGLEGLDRFVVAELLDEQVAERLVCIDYSGIRGDDPPQEQLGLGQSRH